MAYNRVRMRRFTRLGLCLLLAVPVFGWQGGAKKLYVDGFTTKAGAEKLRDDMIAELRKVSSVSLVSDEANADFILDGGGEVWVKGYRSFSPRSELKLPSNGTPIYGGFLSVELKNKQGVTLWSYLVTPEAPSADISKDLSKRVVKHLAEALSRPDPPDPAGRAQTHVSLHGAGATFPYPVYAKWFTNYAAENPGTHIAYDAVGSEAGVRDLIAGSVEFGASDSPDAIREVAPASQDQYLFFPSVVGAVVPIVNLPGVPDSISFTPEALAGIYLGKITKWNDPILKQANRGVRLPDLDIVVVHRSDGSGTSYAWTSYLSKANPEWKATVGASLSPKWPTGRGASGNEGVADVVKEIGGSIGYVEFIYALQNHLSYGRVRNMNGEFVEASLESIGTAVNQSMDVTDDLTVSLADAPGAGSYPIATFTWLVVPAHMSDDAKRSATIAFLKWMLGPGQRQAAALGYLPLSKDVLAKEEAAISKIH